MYPLQTGIGSIVEAALVEFVRGVRGALPELVAGVVFLVLAAVGVKVVTTVVGAVLARTVPDETETYRQLVTTVVGLVLWFGVGLSFLTIVGLDDIAASLGTAAGFAALGVSYAVSNMIADAVAGVYLLRDPDFNPGDRVEAAEVEGEVRAIELRKTRFDVDGDVVVRANADIEKRWTKVEEAPRAVAEDD